MVDTFCVKEQINNAKMIHCHRSWFWIQRNEVDYSIGDIFAGAVAKIDMF